MLHWLGQTMALATWPVAKRTEPVQIVARDDDERADWQLLCDTVPADDPQVYHLFHALDRDQSLLEVLDLEPGQRAERRKLRGGWKRSAY